MFNMTEQEDISKIDTLNRDTYIQNIKHVIEVLKIMGMVALLQFPPAGDMENHLYLRNWKVSWILMKILLFFIMTVGNIIITKNL